LVHAENAAICSVVNPSASSTTARGLPDCGVPEGNTSIMRKGRVVMRPTLPGCCTASQVVVAPRGPEVTPARNSTC